MLRLRVAELLDKRGWTPYRLAQETGMPITTAYRVAARDADLGRIEGRILERLCEVFGVQPGELLEWVPDGRRRRSR